MLSYLKGQLINNTKNKNSLAHSSNINVPCDKGDYLTGYIDSGDNAVTLDISDSTGSLSRRLVDHKSGKQNFYLPVWRKNCDATWRLSGSGAYQVVLEQRISLEEQNLESALKNSDTLLSPKVTALPESLTKGQSSDPPFWADEEVLGTPLVEDTAAGTVMTFLARGRLRQT